jgi:hypothetical protein
MVSFPVTPVPTLSTQGWVTDPSTKFDKLLSDFFLADHNQTYIYKGSVRSLQGLIEKHGSSIQGLIEDLTSSLKVYLERYYDLVEISILPANDVYLDPRARMELKISIGVNDKGTQAQYSKLLQAKDSAMQSISNLNDGVSQ